MINRKGLLSRATPETLCQKCLKRGHYSYECTASQQSRPYIARPSRSQQLANPKLKPKLTETALNDLDKSTEPSSTKRAPLKKRTPSWGSASVSTISTSRSRSASPEVHSRLARHKHKQSRRSRTPEYRDARQGSRHGYRSLSSSPEQRDRGRRPAKARSRSPIPAEQPRSKPAKERSLSPYSKRKAIANA